MTNNLYEYILNKIPLPKELCWMLLKYMITDSAKIIKNEIKGHSFMKDSYFTGESGFLNYISIQISSYNIRPNRCETCLKFRQTFDLGFFKCDKCIEKEQIEEIY